MKQDIEIAQEAKIRPIVEIAAMPGLPTNPSAENIDIDKNGVITGLF
jgi:formyltetrahydrofolate synthetase